MTIPSYMLFYDLVRHLPRWRDDRPTLYVLFTRAEDAVIEHSHMITDPVEAYHLAEWLVNSGLAHTAWVAATITGAFHK